jgi:hypothetical protein
MLAKVMPHLKVGAQKWTAIFGGGGRSGGVAGVNMRGCTGSAVHVHIGKSLPEARRWIELLRHAKRDSLVLGPAGWFQRADSRDPTLLTAMLPSAAALSVRGEGVPHCFPGECVHTTNGEGRAPLRRCCRCCRCGPGPPRQAPCQAWCGTGNECLMHTL